MVHAVVGIVTGGVAAGAPTPSSGSRARRLRRIRTFTGGRHAAAFPSRESAASVAAVLRNVLCASAADIQLHLSARTGPRAGDRPDLRLALGRCRACDRRFLLTLLLDAASLDDACMGVARRHSCSLSIRTAESMDE